jgi:drug/metabolite transporter (DMT)-like permease
MQLNLFKVKIREAVNDADRLQNPWSVFIMGTLVGISAFVFNAVESSTGRSFDPKLMFGLALTGAFVFILCALYAWIGSKHSRRLAKRVVGAIGGGFVIIGVAYLAYIMLHYAV